jgi:tetratricopeptide (TPR) repeat protein
MTANSHLIDGIMTFSEENYKEAEAALTASLETGTTVAGAYYYRGLARLALGDYENAAQDFTLAVDWEEDVFSCIFNRGVCYYALEQDEKAITDLLYVAENASDESLVLSAVELLSGLQPIEDE